MNAALPLEGQVAIVTGAGTGIGRGIALALARAGARVAVCALPGADAPRTADLVRAEGRQAFAGEFDAAEEGAVAAFVAEVTREFGAPGVLVPNAGVMPVALLEEMSVGELDRCYRAKVLSAALFAKHCLPRMRARGGGSITLMASVTAHVGFARHAFYGAMNAAVTGLARGLAMEAAPWGIRVNTVSPGTVDSPMLHRYIAESGENPHKLRAAFNAAHPRGRIGSIEEVAAAFVFLASPAAANITGCDLRCDGGFSFQGGQARMIRLHQTTSGLMAKSVRDDFRHELPAPSPAAGIGHVPAVCRDPLSEEESHVIAR